MFCTQCGGEVDPNDKFCATCGAPVKVKQGGAQATTVSPEQAPSPKKADGRPVPPAAMSTDSAGTQVPPAAMSTNDAGTQVSPAVMSTDSAGAQVPPQQPNDAGQAARTPWYLTTPGRITMGVVGAILIVSGISKIMGGLSKPSSDKPTVIEEPRKTEADGKRTDNADSKKENVTTTDESGDHDVIITDGNDTIVADPNDTVIVRKDDGTSDYSGGEKFDSWAKECTDADGNPTAYAISELKGWQLETLCQEKGLTWNKEMRQWEGKDYALIVFDADKFVGDAHNRLTDEEIAQLDKGNVASGVVYSIQTKSHRDCTDAYKNYVSSTTVSEDFVGVTDNMSIGAAYGPSMKRMLVTVVNGSVVDYTMVDIIPEGTIASGEYDVYDHAEDTYGRSHGRTVPEAFQSKTGHKLGENQ